MKEVNETYIQDMKESWRGNWFINVFLGLINEQFQSGALVEGTNPSPLLPSFFKKDLFNNIPIDDKIATFEKDLILADGSNIFPPKDTIRGYCGYISENLSDKQGNINVELFFQSVNNAKGLNGLTLDFYETYPTEFTVKCYNAQNVEVFSKDYVNDSLSFATNDRFSNDAVRMELRINKMNKPYVRFRLRYVLFGRGITFMNQDIVDTGATLSTFMHPCSVLLPTQDFTINIDNYDKEYDFDNPDSLINLADIGQDVKIVIGYESLDGNITLLPTVMMELSEYNTSDSTLVLDCVDFLRNENNTVVFDDPTFFTPTTTLYDVAVEVLNHLASATFEVVLDDSLKTVPVKFTQIETTVKEALMMIASAGRCCMILENNKLILKKLTQNNVTYTVSSDDALPFSDLQSVLSPSEKVNVATFGKNDSLADGSLIFPIEENGIIKNSGFVGNQLTDGGTTFWFEYPYQRLFFTPSELVSIENIKVKFKDVHPQIMEIDVYMNGKSLETLTLKDLPRDSNIVKINHKFPTCDKIRVRTHTLYEDYRRCKIEYVSFNQEIIDIPENTILEYPEVNVLDNVRNIIVYYTVSTEKADGTIEDTEKNVIIPCNTNGSDFEYRNPFITTIDVAQSVGSWLKEYYSTQLEYTVNYMGDPSIEPHDKISIANDFNSNVVCRVENSEITFSNGGLSGNIIARRFNNDMVRSKNKLATYRLY